MRKRTILISLFLIMSISFLALFSGYRDIWSNVWNVPTTSRFGDTRFLTLGSEYHALGYDPLYDNPQHNNKHLLNYPRIWHLLFAFGIDQSHTNLMGSIFVLLFYTGLALFISSHKIDHITFAVLVVTILSPAVMLGIERGNTDLIIFFILALATSLRHFSSLKILFLLLFASALKIYPFFGLLYFLKENKKMFLKASFTAVMLFALYILYSLEDLKQISFATPRNALLSYGINVFWMGLTHESVFNIPTSEHETAIARILSYSLVCCIAVTVFILNWRKHPVIDLQQGEFIDAFRIGSGIYLGTFMMGNNYDYRLMFLIFSIPQIILWMRQKDTRYRLVPTFTLFFIILSMWTLETKRIVGAQISFVASEIANWGIFATLFYLLLASIPDWLRDYLR